MHKKILLGVLAAAALAMAAPTMASATTYPGLPSGTSQGYLADSGGNPIHSTVTLDGTLNLVGGVTITCSNAVTATINDDGTVDVTAFNTSGCTVSAPFGTCPVTVTSENIPYGGRIVWDGTDYKLHVDVSFNVNFLAAPPTCPVQGSFTDHGTLSPTISISGSVLTATFSGSSSGSLTSPLGSAVVNGPLTSTTGISSGDQLVN